MRDLVATLKPQFGDAACMVMEYQGLTFEKRRRVLPLPDEEAMQVYNLVHPNPVEIMVINKVDWINNRLDKIWFERTNTYIPHPHQPPAPMPHGESTVYVASAKGPVIPATAGPVFKPVVNIGVNVDPSRGAVKWANLRPATEMDKMPALAALADIVEHMPPQVARFPTWAPKPAASPEEQQREALQRLSVAELKAKCKAVGVTVSGNKAELVERILQKMMMSSA